MHTTASSGSTKKEPKELKSILVTTSRVISREDNLGGGEETEIAVQISVPREGGWGWVVVAAAFSSIFLLDGIAFSYGAMMSDVAKDFGISDSLACLVNSICIALYFSSGPVVGAMINRFGFRSCIMAGATISSSALFLSYFIENYVLLCLFYGFTAGFGYCLINMSSSLIVGFYFEKLRSVALAMAASGSSMGIMIQYPLTAYLTQLAGWRTTTLLHCSALVAVFFLGMTYRPLLSVTIRAATGDTPQSTRTVTYLPSVTTVTGQMRSGKSKSNETLQPTAAERLFSAVSNVNFPTAAATIKPDIGVDISQNAQNAESLAGPSTQPTASRYVISTREPSGGFSKGQLKQIQSIISRGNIQDRIETVQGKERPSRRKRNFFGRLCHWQEHVQEDRPLYRDDVFYEGNIKDLPTYQKSTVGIPQENLTGLEYRLAVSRAATTKDLGEKRGFCTTAVRRVLATMLDPSLLKRKSFVLLSASAFVFYLGYLVPFVFIATRNEEKGIARAHCDLFVSVIGFANTIGRVVLGCLTAKIHPLRLFQATSMIVGVSTILSMLSFSLFYQYGYCLVFGFCISCITSLRSAVLVKLYGIEKLTNATGILLLFQGIGCLVSTPLAGAIKETFGFTLAFILSGVFIVLGAMIQWPMGKFLAKENLELNSSSETKRPSAEANSNIPNKSLKDANLVGIVTIKPSAESKKE